MTATNSSTRLRFPASSRQSSVANLNENGIIYWNTILIFDAF